MAHSLGLDPNSDGLGGERDVRLTAERFEALRAEEWSVGKEDAACRNKHFGNLRAEKQKVVDSEIAR
jgi:hypothetical protein